LLVVSVASTFTLCTLSLCSAAYQGENFVRSFARKMENVENPEKKIKTGKNKKIVSK